MLLIVMHESGTWRAEPGQVITFGRSEDCTIRLPGADRGLSRTAGSFSFHDGAWWLRNDSHSSLLYLTGDRGMRVDLPPGMRMPLEQWHAKVRLQGVLGDYILRLRLPELDDADGGEDQPGREERPPAVPGARRGEQVVTSTHHLPSLSDSDRLVLAARFEEYLTWRHSGVPAPKSAKSAAGRIGWQPHTVAKRCENIRDRYSRQGAPGLHGPRALEELAALLISTGELTPDDLRRLPGGARAG